MAYGLSKDATLIAYEIETTDGTDFATTRILFPGLVLNPGTFVEDYQHQTYSPQGSARNPHHAQKLGERFEMELQTLMSEITNTANDWVALLIGTIATATGVVSEAEPLRTFIIERGWNGVNPFYHVLAGCKLESISWSFRANEIATMTSKIMGRIHSRNTAEVDCATTSLSALSQTTKPAVHFKDCTFTFQVGDSTVKILPLEPFQVGETVTCTGGSAVVQANGLTGLGLVLDNITSFDDGEIVTGGDSGATRKIKSSSGTNVVFEPFVVGDRITTASAATGDVIGSGSDYIIYTVVAGAALDGETLTGVLGGQATSTGTPVATLGKVVSGAWVAGLIVREFDLTIANNLEAIASDNQQLYISHLIEKERGINWTLKVVRESNLLLDILRSDPNTAAGQLAIKLVVNQGATGWYMAIDLGVGNSLRNVLAEHDQPEGQDVKFLETTLSGVVIRNLASGESMVDMKE